MGASEAPWQTTSSTAFRGFDNKTMRNAKLPTTMDPNQPNQTFPDEEEEFQRQTRYQSSHKTQFLDFSVGKGRHVMIKKRTNDPSEPDHPTLGRHDYPGRLEKQSAMGPAITTSANAYANPGRESYQPLRKIDPFRHTSTAWNESWKMSDQDTKNMLRAMDMANLPGLNVVNHKERPRYGGNREGGNRDYQKRD